MSGGRNGDTLAETYCAEHADAATAARPRDAGRLPVAGMQQAEQRIVRAW
jgi:hypothetical protein